MREKQNFTFYLSAQLVAELTDHCQKRRIVVSRWLADAIKAAMVLEQEGVLTVVQGEVTND